MEIQGAVTNNEPPSSIVSNRVMIYFSVVHDTSLPLKRVHCGLHFREMTAFCFTTIANIQILQREQKLM